MLSAQTAMFRPLVLKLKVHEDNWNDEQRVRVSIIRVEPTDLVRECSVSCLGSSVDPRFVRWNIFICLN